MLFCPRVSYFSDALTDLLAARPMAKTAFAAEIGMEASKFSRYATGVYRPDREILRQICTGCNDDSEISTLLIAHLRDELPEPYRHLIHIVSTVGNDRIREESVQAWREIPLPAEIAADVQAIAQEAVKDQRVRELLSGLADVVSRHPEE